MLVEGRGKQGDSKGRGQQVVSRGGRGKQTVGGEGRGKHAPYILQINLLVVSSPVPLV